MKRVVDFLRQLDAHNDREWFQSHKVQYQEATEVFNDFATRLIEAVGKFDSSCQGLTLKDCTYRIYRDLRFSQDKRPYKTHMGVFIAPGGKKSGYSGYYFHVSTGYEEGYPTGHIVAIGDYCCDPKVLKILREDIDLGDGDFDRIVRQAYPGLELDTTSALKKVPAGFSKDSPWAEYLKLKVFCLTDYLNEDVIASPDLLQQVVARFQSAQPFIAYINRAIDYVRDNRGE